MRDLRKELAMLKKKQRKDKSSAKSRVKLLTERQADALDLWTGLPLTNSGGITHAGRKTQKENY